MSSSKSVVVVGYGTMGVTHTRKIAGIAGLDVTGAVDINSYRREAAREDGLHVYPDLGAALADDTVDIVLIATPNDDHFPIAVAALEAGKHVLCEKPAMLDSQEMAKVAELAQRQGLLFMVHQNRRWDPDYAAMKRVHDEGTIGRVTYVETRIHGSRGIPGDWRGEAARGGGMLLDWGVHLVDRLLLLVGTPLTSVYGSLSYDLGKEVEDGVKAYLTFADGTRALVDVSTSSFVTLPKWYLQSARGTAVVEDWEMHGKVVVLEDEDEADAAPVRAGAGMTKTMAPRLIDFKALAQVQDAVSVLPLPDVAPDVDDWYRNAVAVIDGTAEPTVRNDQVIRTLRVLEAIRESHETGQTVPFEPAAAATAAADV